MPIADSTAHTTASPADAAPNNATHAQSCNPPASLQQSPGHINTVLFDSIVADTVSGRVPHFLPPHTADSLKTEALLDSLAGHSLPSVPDGHHEGIAPQALPRSYFNSTPLTALLISTLLLAALNGGMLQRALKAYRSELWSVRRRLNMFDDEQRAPLPMAVTLALIFCVFGGITVYNLHGIPADPSFAGAAASMALTGAYYIFQLCAYGLVGYTFGTPDGQRRWLGGFAATQAFAGLGLIIPAFLFIFRPEWHTVLLTISLTIYFAARLLFIAKGVRIFYRNLGSLLYFILYLCTLEILPALAIYRLAGIISLAF